MTLPAENISGKEDHLLFFTLEPNLNYVTALGATLGYYRLTTPRIFAEASMVIAFGRPGEYALSGSVFAGYAFPLFERSIYGFAIIPGVFAGFHRADYYHHNPVNGGIGVELAKFFVISEHWRLALTLLTAVAFIPTNEIVIHIQPSLGAGFSW
jgi:hypothetical protein